MCCHLASGNVNREKEVECIGRKEGDWQAGFLRDEREGDPEPVKGLTFYKEGHLISSEERKRSCRGILVPPVCSLPYTVPDTDGRQRPGVQAKGGTPTVLPIDCFSLECQGAAVLSSAPCFHQSALSFF